MIKLLLSYLKTNWWTISFVLLGRFLLACCFIISWHEFFSFFENQCMKNKISLIKTIYFNFRSFPLKQAVKMPAYLYGRIDIVSLKGSMIISDTEILSGMLRIGYTWGFRSKWKTRFVNRGKIILKGKDFMLGRGGEISVLEGGCLEIGRNVQFAENVMIMCTKYINVGNNVRIAYNSQMFDSDFHYTISFENKEIRPKQASIIIGDYNWIGNHTTIKKGTVTPAYTIVAASYSVLTKDYTKVVPEYSIIGGCPAKLIASGYARTWNNEFEIIKKMDDYYKNNPLEKSYSLSETESIEDYIRIR